MDINLSIQNSKLPLFGPAGSDNDCAAAKCKSTEDSLRFLSVRGIDAFEYQCGRGINIKPERAQAIGNLAAELNIVMSLHAPYYISLASNDEQKREASIQYILKSAHVVHLMGGRRIVVHPGGLSGYPREEAFARAKETLTKAIEAVKAEGLDTIICPEVMGKINQLGDLRETLELCTLAENIISCVDFGHLNSRLQGRLDYKAALDEIFGTLGQEKSKNIHIHFSKIEYSKSGEIRHLTFEDDKYGPDFEPLIDEIKARNMTPVIICESDGTQSRDALAMKEYYLVNK